jgi:hypothetical protein
VSICEGDLRFNETPADLTPKPLWVIAVMGHGGARTLIDANYPADALHSRTLPPAGASTHHPYFPPERQYLDHNLYPASGRQLEPW